VPSAEPTGIFLGDDLGERTGDGVGLTRTEVLEEVLVDGRQIDRSGGPEWLETCN